MNPECSSCAFSNVHLMERDMDGIEGATPVLECRRFPPQFTTMDGEAVVGWPQVDGNEWCGEYAEIVRGSA